MGVPSTDEQQVKPGKTGVRRFLSLVDRKCQIKYPALTAIATVRLLGNGVHLLVVLY